MLSFAQATGALDKLIDRDQDFRLLGTGFGFTEGPAWNTPGNYLMFSDIPGDRRWRWSEQGGMELDAWPTYKGNGMAYEADGSLLVCEQVTSSLIRIRPDGLAAGRRLPLPGQVPEQPQRRRSSVRMAVSTSPTRTTAAGRWPSASPASASSTSRACSGCRRAAATPSSWWRRRNSSSRTACASRPTKASCTSTTGRTSRPTTSRRTGRCRTCGSCTTRWAAPGCRATATRTGWSATSSATSGAPRAAGSGCIAPGGDLLGIIETPEVSGSLVWGGEDLRSLFVCTSTTMHLIRTKVGPAPLPY